MFIAISVGGKASSSDVDALVAQAVGNATTSFPAGDATVWAAPVIKLFATYDPARSAERTAALAPYTGGGLDPQLGWNGAGSQKVVDMVVNPTVTGIDGSNATVHASVQVDDGSWRCIAIPMYAQRPDDGGRPAFGLAALPVYEPCAGVTIPPRNPNQPKRDDTLAKEFTTTLLPSFMGAWIAGDSTSLTRYVLPGQKLYGLGGAFTGAGEGQKPAISDVVVPAADDLPDPARRTISFTASLLGLDGRAQQRATYDVDVVQDNGQWFIASDPRPATTYSLVGGSSLPNVKPTSAPPTTDPAVPGNTQGR
ncbi:hypothetical protein GS504_01730 [Rhodococcus hoagii]|nr:hypothetical protein [Prescottella equi]NKS71609.1 hypothetical protein [Prescottella equi]